MSALDLSWGYFIPEFSKKLQTVDLSRINMHLPMELLREIFLYCIEGNQMKSGQLASVCRHWRSVIISIASLWSTLRVETWTETERVATWLQRAHPKKVVIDIQGHYQNPSFSPFTAFQDALISASQQPGLTPSFSALRDALESAGQWQALTISSLLHEELVCRPYFQAASPMHVLKMLHVAAECVHAPLLTHVLNLVPTDAPLSDLRLYSSFASFYFLQPHWFPALQNLTVLIVNGKDMDAQFELLPNFTQLQIFEADHLPLPMYELNTNLPLLCTLQKLRLRASSVQWMAGRQFPCLEECAILLPHHWEAVHQHEVELPSCKKLTYHGYPTTTVQYFLVPKMRVMDLRSHDCRGQRVFQHLQHLCTVDGRISKLTTLHLTFQCSEQAIVKILRFLGLLQELVLSIAYPSSSWQRFLGSLAAKPSTKDWPKWVSWDHWQRERWCSSQNWHTDVLPHLKYLGIQCPKGFSQYECLDNSPLLRLVGWTRSLLTPPLEHLEVWEGRGTANDIVVDYISAGYLDRHYGLQTQTSDAMIVSGMATQHLVIESFTTPLFRLSSTVLFRQLQDLEVRYNYDHEIPILPCLEQIRRLKIRHGIVPAYPLSIDLPLVRTLQWLGLGHSTLSWMLGRTFQCLREFKVDKPLDLPENKSRHEALQVGLPACTTLDFRNVSVNYLRLLSCPNLQSLQGEPHSSESEFAFDQPAIKALHDFLHNCSRLRTLEFLIARVLELDSLMQFVFCDAWEQGVGRDIKSVQVKISLIDSSSNDENQFFSQMVLQQRIYEKRWNMFTVTRKGWPMIVTVRASM